MTSKQQAIEPIRAEVEALRQRHSGATLTVLDTPGPAHLAALPEYDALLAAEGVALTVAAPHTSRDALLLVLPPHAEFNQDFLNRVSITCQHPYNITQPVSRADMPIALLNRVSIMRQHIPIALLNRVSILRQHPYSITQPGQYLVPTPL
ncbi:hypothetical protein HF086_005943 [Spodoptera exigua]|uniref:Uncharacterized protein n=1 Tax=Spodoptera exigua TaxID=7107 RepID=A0A922MV46_SPOEX|nr:hypothetical protein HF086_005943 [Spodoptera exigua]